MLMMVLLKIISDLGFYLTVVGFLLAHFGAKPELMFAGAGIVSAAFLCTYFLRERGILRFLPLLGLAGLYFLPGMEIIDYVTAAPMAVYTVFLCISKAYEPEWDRQVSILSLFWKVFAGVFLLNILFGDPEFLIRTAIPAGIVTLAADILLARSLRHEPSVYRSARYQLVNLAAVAAVLLVAAFLSSPVFLSAVTTALVLFYEHVAGPLLMFLIYAAIGLARRALDLLTLLRREGELEFQLEPVELSQLAEDLQLEGEYQQADILWLLRALEALGILLACALLVLFFLYLARRARDTPTSGSSMDERFSLDDEAPEIWDSASDSNVRRVREAYRRFLRLVRKRELDLNRSDTSADVSERVRGAFPREETDALRALYLAARYNDRATREDALAAQELYSKLKKS